MIMPAPFLPQTFPVEPLLTSTIKGPLYLGREQLGLSANQNTANSQGVWNWAEICQACSMAQYGRQESHQDHGSTKTQGEEDRAALGGI